MDCDDGIKENSVDQLLNSFSSLQTNEKDDLVVGFQSIANELSYTTARFFLEMNNWNLQASLSCYFDFVASSNQNNGAVPMPSMRVVRELTIGLGESVTPDTQFTQSWLLENNGTVVWPEGCYLKLVSEINNDGKMPVPQIAPQDTHVLTISLVSPSEVGQFKSQFCLCTPNGATFGPIIWSVVDVSLSGTLALTQQLTQLQTSPKEPTQSFCANWDEDGMEVTPAAMSANASMALVPHCSNIIAGGGTFPLSNQLSMPAPQNSPNTTHDEEMIEKINSHNL